MKPDWLKVKLTVNNDFRDLRKIVGDNRLHTVCQSARCPNQNDCWQRRTATLMILGNSCTRNCRFCAVATGKPAPIDPDEPDKVSQAVKLMGLKYAVVTSVTRDDLPDGGAAAWAETIREIRRQNSGCKIEVLIPDFRGDIAALETVLNAEPDILGHNLETVRSLYPVARPQADYDRSLRIISESKKRGA
ncbi:MAG: lipoyl synthase, partial [Candidatus Neomarinimicrobiota bacterium]